MDDTGAESRAEAVRRAFAAAVARQRAMTAEFVRVRDFLESLRGTKGDETHAR